jgi:DNA (cytosine-5)-methyltransferase 1
MRILDLFCGAGGAGMGYSLAGFEVVGVDLEPQPRYPFEFVQGDALEFLDAGGARGFDAVHASPPCQAYTALRSLPWLRDRVYWESIPPTLERLERLEVPWILENVQRAPVDGITLCGTMFGLEWPDGLPIYRHRRFASSEFLLAPGHPKHHRTLATGDDGRPHGNRDRMDVRGAHVRGRRPRLNNGRVIGGHQAATLVAADPMGVGWMVGDEAGQSIPPAYTQWLGEQLLGRLG